MNQIAERLSEASVIMEGTPHPELAEALRIGAEEIQRLQGLVDKGIESVWVGRRFYFKVLRSPDNTPLAIVFNNILTALGETPEQGKANWLRYYPPEQSASEPQEAKHGR